MPMGRWLSPDAAERVASNVDMTQPVGKAQLFKLCPEEGIVVHPPSGTYPPSNRKYELVPSDYAIGIPQHDGTAHVFSIDETHPMHPNF